VWYFALAHTNFVAVGCVSAFISALLHPPPPLCIFLSARCGPPVRSFFWETRVFAVLNASFPFPPAVSSPRLLAGGGGGESEAERLLVGDSPSLVNLCSIFRSIVVYPWPLSWFGLFVSPCYLGCCILGRGGGESEVERRPHRRFAVVGEFLLHFSFDCCRSLALELIWSVFSSWLSSLPEAYPCWTGLPVGESLSLVNSPSISQSDVVDHLALELIWYVICFCSLFGAVCVALSVRVGGYSISCPWWVSPLLFL
jgi:hypothetical protein